MENLEKKDYKNSGKIKNNKIIVSIILSIVVVSVSGVLFFIFKDVQIGKKVNGSLSKQEDNSDFVTGGITLDLDDICGSAHLSGPAEFCYINAAVDQRDIDICRKTSNDSEWMFREYCEDMLNEKLAYEQKDVSLCLLCSNERECIEKVAELKGDASVCQHWPKGLKIEVCEERAKIQQAIVTQNKEICDGIDFYQTKSKCYGELGVVKNDPALCDLAGNLAIDHDYDQDKRECYRKLAMINMDQEYCQYMYEENEEYCIGDVNTIKENFIQCVAGPDKKNCLAIVLEIIDDVEDCRMTSDETAYYPIGLKNCYSKVVNKCKRMSSETLKEECVAFVNKKYNQEIEENEEFDSYIKQLGLDKKLELINIKYDLSKVPVNDIDLSGNMHDNQIYTDQNEEGQSAAKTMIFSTVPMMIKCMDDNGYMMEPVENGEICRGNSSATWPVISDQGGRWGGCEMSVQRINGVIKSFEYCATMTDGSIFHCSKVGCMIE